jgi:hypothetical protein
MPRSGTYKPAAALHQTPHRTVVALLAADWRHFSLSLFLRMGAMLQIASESHSFGRPTLFGDTLPRQRQVAAAYGLRWHRANASP